MTKHDIISKMKSLNLPKGSYVVFGSGPLAALGIREVNDIDLLVSPEVLKDLKKRGWQVLHNGPKFDVFEAYDNWNFGLHSPTLTELLVNATEVDGVTFASLHDVRKWKSGCIRLKDAEDLKLIDNYLASVKGAAPYRRLI